MRSICVHGHFYPHSVVPMLRTCSWFLNELSALETVRVIEYSEPGVNRVARDWLQNFTTLADQLRLKVIG